jgi:predicted DNA-binding protein YlxM (UPF0122 family)
MKPINNNLLVAPHFPDGEVVNAFLIRMSSYSGSHSLTMACRQLLRRKPGLDGMPSFLGKFHEEVGHLYGDIDTLIDKHTEYNFFCCGLPRSRFAEQRARLIEMHRGPVRLARLPLLFSQTEASYLQCSECEEQQKKEFGFAFVHRRTAAPFVNVCPLHGLELRPKMGHPLLFDGQCQSRLSTHQRNMTIELGRRIEQCMETPALESQYHKDDLLLLMKDANWIGCDQRFHVTAFVKSFTSFFNGAFGDARLSLMCQSEKRVETAVRALTRADKALHPEWCVLFRWFVEEQSFSMSPRTADANVGSPLCRRTISSKLVPLRGEIEVELAKTRNLRATAKAMGLSVPLLTAYCKRYGINIYWRPKVLTEQRASEIEKALKEGLHPNEVANEFNISATSVYRQIAASGLPLPSAKEKSLRTVADKAKWLKVVQENPNASRHALRRMQPALWMRLYRNEGAWLEDTLPAPLPPSPAPRARPPEQLSCKLNAALSEAAELCTSEQRKRMHMSSYRLQNLTGVTPYALKRCENDGSVDKHEESCADFAKARISRLSKAVGRPLKSVSVIAKEAGLRTETVRKVTKK